MRLVTVFAVAAAAGAVLACADAPEPTSMTNADLGPKFAKPVAPACATTTEKTIGSQQVALFAKPLLDSAQAHFQPVIDLCSSSPQAARDSMLSYVQWTIGKKDSIQAQKQGVTTYGALLTHWNTVFPYVGYIGVDQPSNVPETVLNGGGGTAGVITQQTTNRELRTPIAALTLDVQDENGDARPHLFVIYPLNSSCLGDSNLRRIGPCYEFGAYPKVNPGFSPQILVGVCQPEGPDHHLEFGALGHNVGTFVAIPNQQTYPTCLNAYSVDDGSWTGGFGDVVKRLAAITRKTFGVQTAYAVHGGLGGLGTGISPFGGVDLEVFHATFDSSAVGVPPDSLSPEVGTWKPITVTPPGSILVQSSLGESIGNLVVLNQAGGACKRCGGLLLQGNLYTAPGSTPAHDGIYEATFIALQDNANMKSASFKMRDGNNTLAEVTFTVTQNTNKILFNGGYTNVNWVRHVPLSFRVRLDLKNQIADLWIDNTRVAHDIGFVTKSSTFSNISADFGGIDSGVMGWDEIRVVRLQDSQ